MGLMPRSRVPRCCRLGEVRRALKVSSHTGTTDLLFTPLLSPAHCSELQVSEQAHTQLVSAVAAAAARYGHVMFPENAHEPALEVGCQLVLNYLFFFGNAVLAACSLVQP